MALRLSPTIKLAQLKTLAVACGLPSSGTKGILTQRLETAVGDYRRNALPLPSQRILSIDLGIRNLAFSLLTPGTPLKGTGHGFRGPPPVKVKLWRRVALAGGTRDDKTLIEKEQWHPGSMAELTLNLVLDQLLNIPPTHILIERQRFRSGGGVAVQEWTLRVNTLEAMIHATLRTLKKLGHWEGEVYSIAPGRVGPFWLDDDAALGSPDKAPDSRKSAKARNKKAKIDLVGNWLEQGKIDPLSGAKNPAQSYIYRWKGGRWKGGRRSTKSTTEEEPVEEFFDKLDDLADCLLQGMAWIKWEENKRLLAQYGPMAILGSSLQHIVL
ncbi:mitochondrial putative cruciform cutting endonuclease 1 [Xylariales sp. AK1849]|nr:mitochondrial putative cruciform cutting endonuclease 1 [Xylariales sp. AK1849]